MLHESENMKKEINNYVNNNRENLRGLVNNKAALDTEKLYLGAMALGFITSMAFGEAVGKNMLDTTPVVDFVVKAAQGGLFAMTGSMLIDVVSKAKNLRKEYREIENSPVVKELSIENSVDQRIIRESILNQAEADMESEL